MESFEGDEKFNLNASFSQELEIFEAEGDMICNARVWAIAMMKSKMMSRLRCRGSHVVLSIEKLWVCLLRDFKLMVTSAKR